MQRLTRYTNFDELKSATNSTQKPDLELFKEYKELVETLRQALTASKESEKKMPVHKREHGE